MFARLRTTLGVGALFASLALGAPAAWGAQVQGGTGSGLAGATIDVPITSTSSLTGFDVLALQFSLNYNPAVVTPIAVVQPGSLTGVAGWAAPEFSVQPISVSQARLSVSQAGTTALIGTGALLFLRFQLNPALLIGGSTALSFASFTYNEGAPNDTTTNGLITVNPTPQITVNPSSAIVYRTSTQQFTVSGSSPPVTWSTTNPGVASISAGGLLTGVTPGTVRVIAVDGAARRDTTDGVVEVRGMRLTAGSATVVQGFDVQVPLLVTPLDGLGVRAGQVTLTYNANLLTPKAILTPLGTLLNGYGPVGIGTPSPGTVTIDFAGNRDLTGFGTLCQLTFTASAVNAGTSTLAPTVALFNETLPAVTVNGIVSVTGVGTLTAAPDQVTLLAGQTQQYTVTGTPTPTAPIIWTVLDPLVASIGPSGLLTALRGGDTQVRAQDALGALDLTTAVRVYDFAATLGTVQATPGATLRVSLTSDRLLGALDIRSLQYSVLWTGTAISNAFASNTGLAGPWQPSGVVTLNTNPRINVAGAGALPLDNSGTEVHSVQFVLSPAAVPGTNIPLTLSGLLFNEGTPRALVTSGAIQVRNTADAGPARAPALSLSSCEPNPVRVRGIIRFTLPNPMSPVRLGIYALDGRLVRRLHDGALPAGTHEIRWDALDGDAHVVAAGLYFCRLETPARSLTRKLAVTP